MRRANLLRGARPFPDLAKRPVIVIDDGLASGITMSVAAISLKKGGAGDIIIAVPTGHAETVNRLAANVEALYCANIRSGWSFAVADAYETWSDVSEKEAQGIIERFQ
jgi:predicted phosphoribosyltransferase